jgi:hypothetical protein
VRLGYYNTRKGLQRIGHDKAKEKSLLQWWGSGGGSICSDFIDVAAVVRGCEDLFAYGIHSGARSRSRDGNVKMERESSDVCMPVSIKI